MATVSRTCDSWAPMNCGSEINSPANTRKATPRTPRRLPEDMERTRSRILSLLHLHHKAIAAETTKTIAAPKTVSPRKLEL